ncbi:iron-containing alcohol dehydrogenase [soil metagenome]
MSLSRRSLDLDFHGRLSFGVGSVDGIGGLVAGCGGRRAFIVTDPGVSRAGVTDLVQQKFPPEMYSVVFEGVTPNPTTDDVESGASALRDFGIEQTVVVAVGGGSAMDAAKAISLHATNGGPARDLADPASQLVPGLPIVAVPTTAGTAAETNGFGVITDVVGERKFYIGHESVKPRRCVLDPALTVGLPPGITAATGIDALSHALEALMSRNANPVADGLALHAVGMISGWLPTAVARGGDLEARSQMLFASNLAGQAFATGTGLGLCHAIAHPLGARLGVPHGVAIAGVLPGVMDFNLPVSAEKISQAASPLGVARSPSCEENARAGVEAVKNLIARVMCGNVLPGVTVADGMLARIVQDCLKDPVISNTPRMPSFNQVEEILRDAVLQRAPHSA